MLGDVLNRVFDGSAKAVLMGLFEQSDMKPNEPKELRKLIDQRMRENQK